MKKLHFLAVAAVLGTMSMTVNAHSIWSARYSMYDFDGGASPAAIELSYGVSVADNIFGNTDDISIEGYIGTGKGDDDGTEISLTYGAEGIYSYGLDYGFTLHGVIGYGYTEIEQTAINPLTGAVIAGTSVESDDSALVLGIGAGYELGIGDIFVQYRSIDYDVDTTVVDIGYKMEIQ